MEGWHVFLVSVLLVMVCMNAALPVSIIAG